MIKSVSKLRQVEEAKIVDLLGNGHSTGASLALANSPLFFMCRGTVRALLSVVHIEVIQGVD
jgi:hypothetical protein